MTRTGAGAAPGCRASRGEPRQVGRSWRSYLQPPMGRRVAEEARVSGRGAEQARWMSDGAAVWTHGTGT